MRHWLGGALVLLVAVVCCRVVLGADQPQWGEAWSRNMVSAEKDLPVRFDAGTRNRDGQIELPPESGVRWVARLGTETYGTPVVAGGRVFVGTNNGAPRDPRLPGDRGVLMCFDERSGRFLWQLCLPKLTRIKWADWYTIGITSTPVVEGDRAYLVSNRGEVLCLDVRGMAGGRRGPFTGQGRLMAGEDQKPIEPGPQDADILWLLDMPVELGVTPHNAANGSVLIHGQELYVATSQGVEWTHHHVPHPEAPSLVVLDKQTGKLLARDGFGIGPDITHGQWSSPAMAPLAGRELLCYAGGNGVLYGFEPLALPAAGTDPAAGPPPRLPVVWRFHGHPLAQTQPPPPPDHQHDSTSYQVTAMPVFYKNRIYVTFTQEPFHGMKLGVLACVDATRTGNVTRGGLVWSYDKIGASVSTVAVADGLVYAPDFTGRLHCLDAETGRCYWVHEAGGPIWGSPLAADGKIYLGSGGKKTLWVLAAGKQLKVISRIPMCDGIYTTPTAANHVLYVATNKHLYAVGGKE
ncbi:MAG: PQQ-binding-like beta-propeller repeat protein [Thermoguttaceae bacterium]|jgi:outer membrane protein assembly factor BamB